MACAFGFDQPHIRVEVYHRLATQRKLTQVSFHCYVRSPAQGCEYVHQSGEVMRRISLTRSIGRSVNFLFLTIPLTSSVLTFYGPRVNYRGLMFTLEPSPVVHIFLAKW